jgi:hypothetical protein
MKSTRDILEMHQNRSIFLLDELANNSVINHDSEPEPINSKGSVLDVLDINRISLNLLEVIIIKLLCALFVLLKELI